MRTGYAQGNETAMRSCPPPPAVPGPCLLHARLTLRAGTLSSHMYVCTVVPYSRAVNGLSCAGHSYSTSCLQYIILTPPRLPDAIDIPAFCHCATCAFVSIFLHHIFGTIVDQFHLVVISLHLPTCFGPRDPVCKNCPPSHLPSQRLSSTTTR